MQVDLLTTEDKQCYFINCEIEGDVLNAGAVYIAPFSSACITLVGEEGVKLTVVLPPDVTNQMTEMVATGTTFFIE